MPPQGGSQFPSVYQAQERFGRGFHSMEEKINVFPVNGNFLNGFSSQWKIFEAFFHLMEIRFLFAIAVSRSSTLHTGVKA